MHPHPHHTFADPLTLKLHTHASHSRQHSEHRRAPFVSPALCTHATACPVNAVHTLAIAAPITALHAHARHRTSKKSRKKAWESSTKAERRPRISSASPSSLNDSSAAGRADSSALSGWHTRARALYAILISPSVAIVEIPRIA
eukprot:177704-Rhodomonas_salina.1